MDVEPRERRILVAGLVAAIGLYVALRLPLLSPHPLRLGWNGDTAIRGLMADRIVDGVRFDVFFWGQNYMGPLTSVVAAGIGLARRAAGLLPIVGPFSVRCAALLEVAAGIVFWTLGVTRLLGAAPAVAVAILLAAGPGWLFRESLLPNGPEMVILLAGVLFWLAARAATKPEGERAVLRSTGIFGFFAGLGWWMNPGVAFVLVAAGIQRLVATPAWRSLRTEFRLVARLLVRPSSLAWSTPEPGVLLALRLANALLASQFLHNFLYLSGFERAAGIDIPLVFLFWPLGEPVVLLTTVLLGCEVAFGRGAWSRRLAGLRPGRGLRGALGTAGIFVAGFLVGYGPVWLGRILGWYPPNYSFSAGLAGPDRIVQRVTENLQADLGAWLGVDTSGWGLLWATGATILTAAGLVFFRSPLHRVLTLQAGEHPAAALAVWTVLSALAFYLLSTAAAAGQQRYIVAALPPAWALLAAVATRLDSAAPGAWKLAARAGATIVALAAFISVVATTLRAREEILSSADPAPVLARIAAGGYQVCYANYWQAYQLQFLSDETVKFIPWHSLNRNPAETRVLAAQPGPRCFVDPQGNVSPQIPMLPHKTAPARAGARP